MKQDNRFFSFAVNSKLGLFDLVAKQHSKVSIRSASQSISFSNSKKINEKLSNLIFIPGSTKVNSSMHGRMQQLEFKMSHPASPICSRIEFCLPDKFPFFLWRVHLDNTSSMPVFIDRITMLDTTNGERQGGVYFPSKTKADLAFFSNGWQSWSYSGVSTAKDKSRRSRLGPFQNNQNTNPSTPIHATRGHFSSDFFGLIGDRISRQGLIAGFLSQKQHFGVIETILGETAQLKLWVDGDHARLDPTKSIATDWAVLGCFSMDEPHPIDLYLDAVARENGLKGDFGDVPVGWCSWYQYYSNVTSDQIRGNLQTLKKIKAQLPLKKFQIDDGWQQQPGDWLMFRKTFSDGLADLVREIRQAGFQPGIWLAPFMVHPGSAIRKKHRDWLYRTLNGKPVYSGFVWDTFNSVLDVTVPQALKYVLKVVSTASKQWKFPYIKLDFLYSAALKGRYKDRTKTRAQVLRNALEEIKQAVGEKSILLGCGLPLGSAVGIFPLMRIGADVQESWYPQYFGLKSIFRSEPYMPSARNSIQNILSRSFCHRKWWINDPDCLLVRPTSQLTLPEVQTLAAAIGFTGGSVMLSDDLSQLPSDRIKLAASLLPPIDQRPWLLDWFDGPTPSKLRLDLRNTTGTWYLLAFFNWTDAPRKVILRASDFKLPPGQYWIRSFWTNEVELKSSGQPLFDGEIPIHGSLLLSVRASDMNFPQYLGSDMHLSQGKEVQDWHCEKTFLKFILDLQRDCDGIVDLYLPDSPRKVLVDSQPLEIHSIGKSVFRINVKLSNSSTIKMLF